jgi:hypothetical protein
MTPFWIRARGPTQVGDHEPVGTVGGRAATAALVLAALAGCAAAPDVARTVEGEVVQLDGVADATVTPPTADRAATLTVTYDDGADAAALATLADEVARVAERNDYATYRLTLVPELEPDSALVVGPDFSGSAAERPLLGAWLAETAALLGPVRHAVDDGGEEITVDSGGGVAQDVAEARRLRYGGATTTWVFRTGPGTFTVGGRVSAGDLALLQAVQRGDGVEGQQAWASSWRLDRRAGHVRLDLEVALDGAPVAAAGLTAARYGSTVAPLVDTALVALAGAGRPSWVRLLDPSGDVLGSWSSEQRAAPGRDPLDRGWDAWLASQAARTV